MKLTHEYHDHIRLVHWQWFTEVGSIGRFGIQVLLHLDKENHCLFQHTLPHFYSHNSRRKKKGYLFNYLGHIFVLLIHVFQCLPSSFSVLNWRTAFLKIDVEAVYVLNLFFCVICTEWEFERAGITKTQVSLKNLHNLKMLSVDLSVILQEVLSE